MQCPKCGSQMGKYNVICSKCGYNKRKNRGGSISYALENKEETQKKTDMVFCQNCNRQLSEDKEHCKFCGWNANVNSFNNQTDNYQETVNGKTFQQNTIESYLASIDASLKSIKSGVSFFVVLTLLSLIIGFFLYVIISI